MSGYLHITNSPIPRLSDVTQRPYFKAVFWGKPTEGIWFAPGLAWIRRMDQDKTWNINQYTQENGNFPYTLKAFEKIYAGQTIRFGIGAPNPLPLSTFHIGTTRVVEQPDGSKVTASVNPDFNKDNSPAKPIYVYDFPIEGAFSEDVASPSKDKILKVTSGNIDAFEKEFYKFFITVRDGRSNLIADVFSRIRYYKDNVLKERISGYITQFLGGKYLTPYLATKGTLNALLRAAVLTILRRAGLPNTDIDRVYTSFLGPFTKNDIDAYIQQRTGLGPTSKAKKAKDIRLLFSTEPLRQDQFYILPPSPPPGFVEFVEPLYRLPKDTEQEMVDNLDWILCYEYGLFFREVIQKTWGGVYFDPSLFPADESQRYFFDKFQRFKFAELYDRYPRLIRFPFLQWFEVPSGTVWAARTILNTETIEPKFSVRFSDTPVTSEDPNLFVAGIDATTKDVFFFKSGTMRGGRRKTTRRRRQLKKTTRKIR